MQAETVNYNQLRTGWRENVKIGEPNEENCQRLLHSLAEFYHMYDGRERWIDMLKLWIKSNPLQLKQAILAH